MIFTGDGSMDGARAMAERFSGKWNYPNELPVVEHHAEIVEAVRHHRVVVVVSDTGSGKTTQLPKMVAEALGPDGGRVGCTQPRRIAAVSVAKRVAAELEVPLGGFVGYQVRFDERLCADTRLKFMTDGILLAETQGDPQLRQYGAIILDEAHERSLNIDFLLGYLKQLIETRDEFRLIISSATLDAGSFSKFFAIDGVESPVIEAPGRMYPVSEIFLENDVDEELAQQVCRAVEVLDSHNPMGGDVLVFLPGEREIRDCAEVLEGRRFPRTEVLPLYARLSLGDQQRVFEPGALRRIILATNVAETSLTIPRIGCVVDSGWARMSRWVPGRGVQRLQVERVSQASARQRKGRCGRVSEGVCVRLYGEEELAELPEFTDPEIRRSSLAGVILRMKSLGLPEITEFPFLDPPSPKAVAEGYRTLREVGALDRDKRLTAHGRMMARLPVDPRLARMLIAARDEGCVAELVPVVAALETNDPRERPDGKVTEADNAHAKWRDADSDFSGILRLWKDVCACREGSGRWRKNALRKLCSSSFLGWRRVIEWANVADELAELLEREWKLRGLDIGRAGGDPEAVYAPLHRSLLSGAPRQFGLWDREQKAYRSASGGFFAVFPGSGLFNTGKRWEWVLGMELVETSRLWARRVARIDPEWVEKVAPHLCHSKFGEARWDEKQGAVYGKETVVCGGLAVVSGRRVHYGRVDAKVAHAVFLREGLLGGGLRKKTPILEHIEALKEQITAIEEKLRRPGGIWSDRAVLDFLETHIPVEVHTAAAFHKWLEKHGDSLNIKLDDATDAGLPDSWVPGHFPDAMHHDGAEYTVFYHAAVGERDDGVTLGVHIDQLPGMPDWLPGWGVDGNLQELGEALLRTLPKDFRRACQPVGELARGFAETWCDAAKDGPVERALVDHIRETRGLRVPVDSFDHGRLPGHLQTKVWVCDDEGGELAMGIDLKAIRKQLAGRMRERIEAHATADVERGGMTSWEGEALPERIETPGGTAFPALVDEGVSVGVRAFTCEAEARESQRAGIARLLWLGQPDQVAWLRKKYPLGLAARVELARLGATGTTLDDLILLAAEGAAGGALPRSPDEFRMLAAATRGQWHQAAAHVGAAIDVIQESVTTIRAWVDTNLDDRNLGEIAEDIDDQLGWLLRARFAWRAGYERLLEYPRYLRAIQSRLGRLKSLPLTKDLEKLDRISPSWVRWHRAWSAAPEKAALWEHGWALEEFRVSLFAPDVPCRLKVSEKRLDEQWATLHRAGSG